ncbi:predicted protein [Histoplasma capsulatum var. duboisii H88]|uniref:Predicted protein n=1 Tax=Ajellomyces capsulatus (strain H88) TaxID=544711 RepID=F0UB36_AJEC8|nr:predicted protein [Histoplasma capsulatum var. duboisii H88]
MAVDIPPGQTSTTQVSKSKKVYCVFQRSRPQSLHLYQLRHKAACLQFLCKNLPDIPAPRILHWDDHAFITQEFIDEERLSIALPCHGSLKIKRQQLLGYCLHYCQARKMRFDFIGGLDPDFHTGTDD